MAALAVELVAADNKKPVAHQAVVLQQVVEHQLVLVRVVEQAEVAHPKQVAHLLQAVHQQEGHLQAERLAVVVDSRKRAVHPLVAQHQVAVVHLAVVDNLRQAALQLVEHQAVAHQLAELPQVVVLEAAAHLKLVAHLAEPPQVVVHQAAHQVVLAALVAQAVVAVAHLRLAALQNNVSYIKATS